MHPVAEGAAPFFLAATPIGVPFGIETPTVVLACTAADRTSGGGIRAGGVLFTVDIFYLVLHGYCIVYTHTHTSVPSGKRFRLVMYARIEKLFIPVSLLSKNCWVLGFRVSIFISR